MGYFTRERVRSLLASRQAIARIHDDEEAERRRLAARRARLFAGFTKPDKTSTKISGGNISARTGLATEAADLRRSIEEVARAQASVRARAAAAGISDRSASLNAVLQQIQRRAQRSHPTADLAAALKPDPKAVARLEADEDEFAEKKRANRRRLEEIHRKHMMTSAAASEKAQKTPRRRAPGRPSSRSSSRPSSRKSLRPFPKSLGQKIWPRSLSRGKLAGGTGGMSGAIWSGADLIRGFSFGGFSGTALRMP